MIREGRAGGGEANPFWVGQLEASDFFEKGVNGLGGLRPAKSLAWFSQIFPM